MPEPTDNFEAVYLHPGGATATFIRHDGELDALAKGLDSEQFWVFKNVKSLLVRNEEGDLAEASRLMRQVGFTAQVREFNRVATVAPEPIFEALPAMAEAHTGPHLPGPSYWPILLAASVLVALGGAMFYETLFIWVTALGLIAVFVCMVGWGTEPI